MINPNTQSGNGEGVEPITYEPDAGFLLIKHRQPIAELNLATNLSNLLTNRPGLSSAISALDNANVRTLAPANPARFQTAGGNAPRVSFIPVYGDNIHAELQDLDQELLSDEDAGFINNGLFQVLGTTPNWAVGGAQAWLTGGGPGAYPVKVPVPSGAPKFSPMDDTAFTTLWDNWMSDTRNSTSTLGRKDTIKRGNQRRRPRELREEAMQGWDFLKSVLDVEGTDTPVEIIILDTVPPQAQLDAAENAWKEADNAVYAPYQDLLVDELLTKEYAAVTLPPTTGHFWMPPGHDYNMSDHGLFVAGVAHSIAKNVPIHLIEVLNEKGVGTLESVIWGFERAVEHIISVRATKPDTRFIINCSLTFSTPNTDKEKRKVDHDFDQAMRAIEAILESVQPHLDAASDVIVVAAAGNEGTNIDPTIRPPARYPAALDSVVGVGALGKNNEPTIYTNFSDTFPNPSLNVSEQGIAIFGGDVLGNAIVDVHGLSAYISDPDNGVLGLYTYNTVYDAGTSSWVTNDSGYARWSGTSFAAPAVAGLLAQLIAHGASPQEALTLLYDIHPGPAPGYEHMLTPITQD